MTIGTQKNQIACTYLHSDLPKTPALTGCIPVSRMQIQWPAFLFLIFNYDTQRKSDLPHLCQGRIMLAVYFLTNKTEKDAH